MERINIGLHENLLIQWKDVEYRINILGLANEKPKTICVFMLYLLKKGVFMPIFYDYIKLLSEKEVECFCKELESICRHQENDKKLQTLMFIRKAYLKNKELFSPDAVYTIAKLHLKELDLEVLLLAIDCEFNNLAKESIEIIVKKSCLFSKTEKGTILKELNK